MKKILYSALAVSLLASCSQDELVDLQQVNNEISFVAGYVDGKTRGEDPSVTTGNIKTFDVWGYVNNSAGKLFEGVAVNKAGDLWSYSPYATQYWYPSNTYRFFALTSNQVIDGKVSENATITPTADPFNEGLGTVHFVNVDGTEDLLFADCPQFTIDADINVKPEPVHFSFDHLLSKVKFTFQNGFSTGLTTISVTNVKMEVANNATITLNEQQAVKGDYIWTGHDGITTLNFGNMGAGALVEEGDLVESDKERFAIPAGDEMIYNVSFDIEVFQNGVSVLQRTKTTKISGCKLLSGHAYNFIAILNQENVSDNPLYPIEFTVDKVEGWIPGEYNGGVIPTNAVTTAEELQAALAEGGLITLVSDIEGDVTVAQNAGVDVTIDGAGHTFDGTITINGQSSAATNKNLVIRNINFATQSSEAMDFISSATDAVRYARNVTIENCTFAAPEGSDVVAIRLRQSYNVLVKDCTMEGGHSFAQMTSHSGEGLAFENCTVKAGRGVNLGNAITGVADFRNCSIEATKGDGYGIRVDAKGENVMNVNGCAITAAEPIVLRNAQAAFTFNIAQTTLTSLGDYDIIVSGTAPVMNGVEGFNIKY